MKQLNVAHPLGANSIKVHVTDNDGAAIQFIATLDQITSAYVQSVLEGSNIDAASRALGISREKVYRIIKKAALQTPKKGKRNAK